MFGRFVPQVRKALFLLAVILPVASHGQRDLIVKKTLRPVSGQWLRAKVVNDGAVVYKNADFDSPVLGRLKAGTQWPISKQIFGPFHQIKIRETLIGYVADVDVNAGRVPPSPQVEREKSLSNKKDQSYVESKRPFAKTNFWGIIVGSVRYREDTMSLRPTDQLTFLGVQFSGPNIVLDDYSTEFKAMISPGAPKYYESATRHSADGFVLLMDFLFQYNYPAGRNTMSFFGFGPMFKYSKVAATLDCDAAICNGKTTGTLTYNLEDMALGAVFNVGITQRFGTFALRAQGQYYWEKLQYYGFSLSGQFAF